MVFQGQYVRVVFPCFLVLDSEVELAVKGLQYLVDPRYC